MCYSAQADKISSLLKAAGVSVEPYWAGLFAKTLAAKPVEDLITNVGAGEWHAQTHRTEGKNSVAGRDGAWASQLGAWHTLAHRFRRQAGGQRGIRASIFSPRVLDTTHACHTRSHSRTQSSSAAALGDAIHGSRHTAELPTPLGTHAFPLLLC